MCLSLALVTNTSCPTWHYYNNATGQCECGSVLICSSDKVLIENGDCVTSSEKEGDFYVGACRFRYTFNSINRYLSEMPSNASQLDEVMCGPYKRSGLLCGECIDGYGPAHYSFDLKCANCSSPLSEYAICLYMFLQFVSSTLIFISLVVCRFNITSGPMLGYVLLCQISLTLTTYRHHFVSDYILSHTSKTLQWLIRLCVTASQFWSFKCYSFGWIVGTGGVFRIAC